MTNPRQVVLPEVTGSLYLHSMPGRYETWNEFLDIVQFFAIDRVVALTPHEECEYLSPQYYAAVSNGEAPFEWQQFTITNYRAPTNWQRFANFVEGLAQRLQSGESILLHCAAGIGRTGTTAGAILIQLGIPLDEATARVRAAGSSPERITQYDVLSWLSNTRG